MLPQIFIFERNLNRFSQDFSGILREKSIREELRATPHAIRDDSRFAPTRFYRVVL
jgi:hypothetical protein